MEKNIFLESTPMLLDKKNNVILLYKVLDKTLFSGLLSMLFIISDNLDLQLFFFTN